MFKSLTNDRKYAKCCVASLSKFLARDKNVVPADPSGSDIEKIVGGYVLMPKINTYAFSVHALQEACANDPNSHHPTYKTSNGAVIYRPLSFEQNLQARVDDFNTLKDTDGNNRSLKDRKRFFKVWLDSCYGIASKKKSTLFKIIPYCEEWITIPKDFNKPFIGSYEGFSYDNINGEELDWNVKNVLYNQSLTKDQFLSHPAWNVAVPTKSLLKAYADIYFDELNNKKGCGFHVRRNTDTDELRALFVDDIDHDSIAEGKYGLVISGSFLRVAQPKAP